jgi:hypothetical protein
MTSGRDLPRNILRFDRDGQAVYGSLQVNKLRPGALVEMAKSGSSSAGPMRTQPLQLGSIHPTQPLMPSAGTEMKIQNRPQRKSPSREDQVEAVKAKISRRNSLRKQRAALKS